MHLSKKAEYTLRAMIHLGLARALNQATVSGSELAEANRLPLKYVERILQELKEAGLVVSKRGKLGGYTLADAAESTRMGDLVRLMDGRLAPIACASEVAYQRCTCPDETHCGLRMLMIDVRNAMAAILDRYTLGQIVEVTLRKMRRDGVVLPFSHQGQAPVSALSERRKVDPADGFLAELSQLSGYHDNSATK